MQSLLLKNTQTQLVNTLVGARQNYTDRIWNSIHKNEYRIQPVATVNKVMYVNDAGSTSVDDTFITFEVLPDKLVWIVGEYNPTTNYQLLKEITNAKVDAIICFGSDNNKLLNCFLRGDYLLINATDLNEAVYFAYLYAKKENTVVYSCPVAVNHATQSIEMRGEIFSIALNTLENNRIEI